MAKKCCTWELENRLGRTMGFSIAGCDEVGRGSFGGIFQAAAALFKPDVDVTFPIRDSKAYRREEREEIHARLTNEFVHKGLLFIGYAAATVAEIDSQNLNHINIRLFKEALAQLPPYSQVILDGCLTDKMGVSCPGADATSITVGVASIFAKVKRDRHMLLVHQQYPEYGFDKHMGYGTPEHIQAILKHGAIKGLHRATFLKNLKGVKFRETI